MKKHRSIPKLAAVVLALCAGAITFAQDERYSQIPDGAALVMNLNLGKLYSSPTFKAVAESGDVLAIRNDLKAIPWNKAGTLPDPVIVYAPRMGDSYAILVGTDKTADELFDDIGKKGRAVLEKRGSSQLITLKEQHRNRKTNRQELRDAGEILFLTPKTVAFGRKGNPLDRAFFANQTLPAAEFAMLQNVPAKTVAVGILRCFPVAAADDPTGLSALVKSGDFIVSEYEPGAASLVLNMECKGEKEAQLAVRRVKSFHVAGLQSLYHLLSQKFVSLCDVLVHELPPKHLKRQLIRLRHGRACIC